MRVLKNINNNVSLCLDSRNNEVIVFGKGIGFTKPPYEIPLELIDRTFYNVSIEQIELIQMIPEEILEISSAIIDLANQRLDNQFRSNVVFTLADHINFAINRQQKKLNIKLPLLYEVQQLYIEESYIGSRALELIKEKMDIQLPVEEAASIALHLVNYEAMQDNQQQQDVDIMVEQCAELIEEQLNIEISKKSFNYYRFVSHLHYLMKRTLNDQMIESQNEQIFSSLKHEFPKTHQCALEISNWIHQKFDKTLSDEEILYLILHINRLCSREDCDQ